ncbi:MAG: EamA family transporter [Clostridiaceae bacterium]|nr:EamA family transporter [Clostridiaceae bacterium]
MVWNSSSWILVLSVVVAAAAQILLKKSARLTHAALWREYLNSRVISAYLLLFLSTVLTILAFRGLTYKNGIMIESTEYLFILIFSSIFLKEKISRRKVIGNLLIVAGLIVYYQ